MRNSVKRNAGRYLSRLRTLMLAAAMLPALGQAQTVNICDRTPQVRDEILLASGASDCAAVTAEQLAAIRELCLLGSHERYPCRTSYARDPIGLLKSGDFDGLTSLQHLGLHNNRLTALPADVFDSLTGLRFLYLNANRLTALPAGVFDGLTSLQYLYLDENRLTALPAGVFDGLTSLREIYLHRNQLTALPDGVFDGLGDLQYLQLDGNRLTALPAGVFDGLTSLLELWLSYNQLSALPDGVFDGLINLEFLDLQTNHLVGLAPNDPLFAGLPNGVRLFLDGQTAPPGQPEEPEMPSNGICDRTPQVRDGILLALEADDCAAVESEALAGVRILFLSEERITTLRAGDFDGLTSLRILDLAHNQLTALPVGVFDELYSLERLYLGHNQLTDLPYGVFDDLQSLLDLDLRYNQLTALLAGVFDELYSLENLILDNNHLVGLTLRDPLFSSLPRGVSVYLDGQTAPPERPEEPEMPEQPEEPEPNAQRLAAAVPLMVSASDSMRQGFVRIINESGESGAVRILAFDDGGTAAEPIEIQLGASQSLHFNSNDLEGGDPGKGINAGVGSPMRGDWRLDVETALNVRVLSFVRTTDGFLTAMGDVLPRGADGRLAAHVFNLGSNMNQESKLRLVNTGESAEGLSIEGIDDQGGRGGPVTLTLAAGASRTLTAFELENGAQDLIGTIGDGAGKWRLFITADQAVVGMSLLEAVSGHLTNISAMGVATEGQ